MLLVLLREAFHYGWHLEASADVTAKMIHTENGPDYPVDVHSWEGRTLAGTEAESALKRTSAVLYSSRF